MVTINSPFTNSSQETGVILSPNFKPFRFLYTVTRYRRNGQPTSQPQHNPTLQDFSEICPAFLKRLARSPNPSQTRYFPVVRLLVSDQLISRFRQSRPFIIELLGVFKSID